MADRDDRTADERPIDERPREINKRIVIVVGILFVFLVALAIRKTYKGMENDGVVETQAEVVTQQPKRRSQYDLGRQSFEKDLQEQGARKQRQTALENAVSEAEGQVRQIEHESSPATQMTQERLDHIRLVRDAIWAPMQIKSTGLAITPPAVQEPQQQRTPATQRLEQLTTRKAEAQRSLQALRKKLAEAEADLQRDRNN